MLSYKRIDFKPESIENMQSRFNRALETTYIVNEIMGGLIEPPSQNPDCVFDFEDGLRLIISRELFRDETATHISASIQEESDLFNRCAKIARINDAKDAQEHFLSVAINRYRKISSDWRMMKFIGSSEEKGVPHWIIKENKP